MKATARISAGTLTSSSHDSEKPSRIAMTIPPTAMIGAITSIVNVISTRICTCCTSLVLRVISDAAPKRPISRAENVPTWWKIPARRSRPTAHRHAGAEPGGGDRGDDLDDREQQHLPAGADDVAGVAGRHAVVDDVGVEARQLQRRHRGDGLEDDDQGRPVGRYGRTDRTISEISMYRW